MKKSIDLLTKLYLIFTILIPFKIGLLYVNTIIGMLIISIGTVYLINQRKTIRNELPKWIKKYNILAILYSSICALQIFIVSDTSKFNMVKIVIVLVSQVLLNYYLNEEEKLKELLKFMTFLFVISLTGAFFSYFMGIQKIILSNSIEIVSVQSSLSKFSESRLEWVLHHKSEMAVYTLFAISMFINYIDNKFIRISYVGLGLVIIALTKSKTTLILTIVMIAIVVIKNIIAMNKDIRLKITSVFLGGSIMITTLIMYSQYIKEFLVNAIEGRDIATLGYRTIIWGSAIDTIKNNLLGTGANFTSSMIANPYYDYTTYSNAHNFILQEILESGILGGGIYIIIIILLLLLLFKYNSTVFVIFSTAVLASQMDLAIYNVNKTVMFIVISLFILDSYLKNIRRNSRDESTLRKN